MKNRRSRKASQVIVEPLGQRLLYSADVAFFEFLSEPQEGQDKKLSFDGAIDSISSENTTNAKEVVFVNSNVHNIDLIVENITKANSDADIVVLDVNRHGLDYVNSYLSQYQDLDAVHIVGHGESNSFDLGSESIDNHYLLSQQQNFKIWSDYISQNGSVYLYGCDVASEGGDFVDRLSDILQRNVLASDDDSGSAELGGDWVLEYQSSEGASKSLFDQKFSNEYNAILAPNTAPTFDAPDGKLLQNTSGAVDIITDGAVQADGKILVAGYANDSDWDFLLSRYNSDGTLDTSFGDDGIVRLDLGSAREQAHAVSIQADGKIVLVGSRSGLDSTLSDYSDDFVVIRLLSDGSLDTSFGGGSGYVQTNFADTDDYARDVLIQADGSIVVVGEAGGDVGVIKLDSSGVLDSSFGTDGKLRLDLSGTNDLAKGVTSLADGSLVVIGHSYDSGADLMMINLSQDGSTGPNFQPIRTDFGQNGATATDAFYSVVQQDDGKILAAGSSTANNGYYNITLARFNLDGSPDLSFGGAGYVSSPPGFTSDYARDLKVLADGSIIAVGWIGNDFAVLKYTSNGTLDSSFANGGVYTSPIGGYSVAEAVEVLPDGSVVVIGHHSESDLSSTLIFKLNSDGELDTSFAPKSTINETPSYTENSVPVLLDSAIQISDSELDALDGGLGNYSGSSLTLERSGGANAEDNLQVASSLLVKNGQVIAEVDNSQAGRITVTFTDGNGEIPNSADVDAILSQIVYSNNSDTPPAQIDLLWTFNDGNSGSQGSGGEGTVSEESKVNIIAVNDLPTNSGQPLNDEVAIRNQDLELDLSGIEFSDVDYGGELVRVHLTSSNGLFSGNAADGISIQVYGSNVIINGDMNDVNDYLNTPGNIKYNSGTLGNDQINVSFIVGSNSVDADSFTIDVVENSAPIITAPSSVSIVEDSGSNSISGIAVSDDITNGLVQVTLSSSLGNISLSSLVGVTVISGNDNSTSIVVQGNISNINNSLQSLEYTPALNTSGNGADSLVITVDEVGGGGSPLSSVEQITIDITPVNDTPTTSGSYNTSLNLQEGETVNVDLSGMVISDVDDLNVGISLTIDNGGQLSFNNDSNVDISFNPPTNSYLITGSLNDINNFINASNSIQYSHSDLTLSGNNVDRISVQITDTDPGGGNGITVVLDAINVNIQAINDAPEITGPDSYTLNEDSVFNISGIQISDADAGSAAVSVVLEVFSGTLTLSQNSGLTVNAELVTLSDNSTLYRLTISGSVDDINVALPSLMYTPNENIYGVDSIKVEVNDQGNTGGMPQVASKVSTIVITPAPDPAINTGTVPNVLTAVEDQLSFFDLSSLNLEDPDDDVSSSVYTLRLNVSANGVLTIVNPGAVTVQNNGSNAVEITGSLAQLNQFLDNNATIQYQHGIINTNGTAADLIDITLQQNSTDNLDAVQLASINIDINPVNDAPSFTQPNPILATEGQTIGITGLSIADVDSGSGDMTVRLGVNAGSLLLGQTTGLTVISVTFANSNGDTVNGFELMGTEANINQALDTLSYTAANNLTGPGADELSVIVNDQGNSGGNALEAGSVVLIDIAPQPSNPSNIGSLPTRLQVTEDIAGALDLSAVELEDTDNSSTNYRLTINSANGVLQVNDTSGLTVSTGSNGSVELSGSLADLNTWLNSNNGLLYQHSVEHQFGNAADSVTLSIAEGPGFSTEFGLGSVVIDIAAVNDLATLSTPSTITLQEDSSQSITGIVLSDVDGDRYQVTIQSQQGDVRIDGLNPSLLVGGANDSTLIMLEGDLVDIQQALDSLIYESPANITGSQVDRVDIQLSEVNAGTTENVLNSSIDVDITPENDAPTITLPNQFMATDGQSLLLTGISVADIDAGSGDLTLRVGVLNGNVTFGQTTGLVSNPVTFTNSNGDTVSGVELVGSLADINQALNSLSYINTGNATDSLTLVINDQGNTGGVALEASAQAGIDIAPQPSNPSNIGSLPTRLQVTEDIASALDLSAVELEDTDNSSTNYRLTINSANGVLQVNDTSGLTVSTGSNGSVELSGSLADLNTWLNSNNGLLYQHSVEHQFGNAADSVTLSIAEGPGFSTEFGLGSVVIDIAAVNDLATLSTPSTITLQEDSSQSITGIVLSDVDGDRYQVTIQSQQGDVRIEGLNPSLLVGGANDSTLIMLEGDLADIQQALDSLIYESPANITGSQVDRVDIQLSEVNAGTTENVLNSSIDVDITPENDAPTISEPVSRNVEVELFEDESYTFSLSDFPSVGENGVSISEVEINPASLSGELFLDGNLLVDKQLIGLDKINSDLLVYKPEQDHNGQNADDLEFRLLSNENLWSDYHNLSMNIQAVNDDPNNLGSSLDLIQLNSGVWIDLDLKSIELGDVDATDKNLQLRIQFSEPVELNTTDDLTLEIVELSDNQFTVSGTLQEINTFLDKGSAVQIRVSDSDSDRLALSVHVHDMGNTGIGGSDWVELSRSELVIVTNSVGDAEEDDKTNDPVVPDEVDEIAPIIIVQEEAEPPTSDELIDESVGDQVDPIPIFPFASDDTTVFKDAERADKVVDNAPSNNSAFNFEDLDLVVNRLEDVEEESLRKDKNEVSYQKLKDKLFFSNKLVPIESDFQSASYRYLDTSDNGRDSDQEVDENRKTLTTLGKVGALVGAASSIGLLWWLSRLGSLLAALISVRPLWSDFDPLPILSRVKSNRSKESEKNETLNSDDCLEKDSTDEK